MKKIIIFFIFLCFAITPTKANTIEKIVAQSNLGIKSSLGIYVINSDTNKEIYKKNEQKMLTPASTLKTLTFATSYKVLGENYKFSTEIYKLNNDIYLKLSGDTLLTSSDLVNLFKEAKTKFDFSKINNIYIDDTIINKYYPYPSGWMQDDLWPHSRPITPYIIDKNLTTIAIKRSSLATKVDILQDDDYKLPIINDLVLDKENSKKQDFKIERMFGQDSTIVKFSGTINEDIIFDLPVLKPEINFDIKLRNALKKNEISYLNKITSKKIPQGAAKIAQTSHSIEEISKSILLNSDNFASEVVFRIAAAKFINYSNPASAQDAIDMFYSINSYSKDDIKIADGSGVSRYNLVNTKTAVEIFNKFAKETKLTNLMASANQGTLKDRMQFLENNLKAKTGTLQDMSALIGTLKTKKDKNVSFCIIIQNSTKRRAILKNFENDIITTIYRKY